ncbi:MAG: hypothetical protein NTW21_33025, partial [Verrucomicrobia bacterium]|nr:hypothetical protein [Verrucomicrobiota bacterium]
NQKALDFNAYDEMLARKPDAGNLHVRFDEGEQRDWRKPPAALYSTGRSNRTFKSNFGVRVESAVGNVSD